MSCTRHNMNVFAVPIIPNYLHEIEHPNKTNQASEFTMKERGQYLKRASCDDFFNLFLTMPYFSIIILGKFSNRIPICIVDCYTSKSEVYMSQDRLGSSSIRNPPSSDWKSNLN